jgi:hypothetical protein
MNPLLWLTGAIWLGLFGIGTKSGLATIKATWIAAGAVILALPGLIFSAYYTKLLGEPLWLYQFRSIPFTELLAAGSGLQFGMLHAEVMRRDKFRRRIGRATVPLLGLFSVLLPFLKPVVGQIRKTFYDQWRGDVCMQSTPSTCGPASAATLFRHFGVNVTEEELARECFSSRTGTENWYLARAFRRRGFEVEFIHFDDVMTGLQAPAIAGTRLAGNGHFIPVLAVTNEVVEIGDPMVGPQSFSLRDLAELRDFTGFAMRISPKTTPLGVEDQR